MFFSASGLADLGLFPSLSRAFSKHLHPLAELQLVAQITSKFVQNNFLLNPN